MKSSEKRLLKKVEKASEKVLNSENFDEGLTKVASKGEFKKYCDCEFCQGERQGKLKTIKEEIKFLEYLINSYFLICVGEDLQTPRTDILLRIKTLEGDIRNFNLNVGEKNLL